MRSPNAWKEAVCQTSTSSRGAWKRFENREECTDGGKSKRSFAQLAYENVSMNSEMKKRNRGRWRLIEYLLKCALGILFIFAGATKSWDPAEFAREVSRYQLVPW